MEERYPRLYKIKKIAYTKQRKMSGEVEFKCEGPPFCGNLMEWDGFYQISHS